MRLLRQLRIWRYTDDLVVLEIKTTGWYMHGVQVFNGLTCDYNETTLYLRLQRDDFDDGVRCNLMTVIVEG